MICAPSICSVSPLAEAIRPLLRVAPSGVYLLDRDSTGEVLVLRNKAVWLTIAQGRQTPNRQEHLVREWGNDHLLHLVDSQVFASRWELLTWLQETLSNLDRSAA